MIRYYSRRTSRKRVQFKGTPIQSLEQNAQSVICELADADIEGISFANDIFFPTKNFRQKRWPEGMRLSAAAVTGAHAYFKRINIAAYTAAKKIRKGEIVALDRNGKAVPAKGKTK